MHGDFKLLSRSHVDLLTLRFDMFLSCLDLQIDGNLEGRLEWLTCFSGNLGVIFRAIASEIRFPIFISKISMVKCRT